MLSYEVVEYGIGHATEIWCHVHTTDLFQSYYEDYPAAFKKEEMPVFSREEERKRFDDMYEH